MDYRNFTHYAETMREEVARRFPEPEAVQARRLLSGWRVWCEAHGRSAAMPAEVLPTLEANEDAAGWKAKAWEAAKLGKNFGSLGSTFSVAELADAFLAMHGRGPSGQKFAEEVAR